MIDLRDRHQESMSFLIALLILAVAFGHPLLLLAWRESRKCLAASSDGSADTEFVAEVVRITEILPHGNADKLEIARFELKRTGLSSYPVIVRKGEYKVGDLACYFSVDCLLPLSHPAFAFLKQPGSTKTVHRLRAARLRGVFSQGRTAHEAPALFPLSRRSGNFSNAGQTQG